MRAHKVLTLMVGLLTACSSTGDVGSSGPTSDSGVEGHADDAHAGERSDSGQGEGPTAMPNERYPAKADNDRDGLENGLELQLHTDPEYVDTDGDGESDRSEVGADVSAPRDSDGDGFADAIESSVVDNDQDGRTDQVDAASPADWQLAFARLTPAIIANDGADATTLEAQLVGITASRVTMGMDSKFWFPLLAPDELRVDGALLGHDPIELFDDGTHGDRIAGDGVFAREAITTTMKSRKLDPTAPLTPRGSVMLNSLTADSAGKTHIRHIGYTNGAGPTVLPGSFRFAFVDASAIQKVQPLAPDAQRTDHVLNVVDAELALAVVRNLLAGAEGTGDDRVNELVAVADRFSGPVDFMYVYPSGPTYGPLGGCNIPLSNETAGIGAEVNPAFPVDRGMKSLMMLDHAPESPIHHETMHHWAVYLDALFGFDTATHHWGTAGTLGVLGGFDPDSLVDHGDGTYTVDRFEPSGGDWLTTPYSNIELYLMGLIAADEVDPIPVLINPTITDGTNPTTVTVQSELQTVTVDDIIQKHGTRTPAAGSAQKDFKGAFVILSERMLTPAELAFVDGRARALETTTLNEMLSFSAATRGLGTMHTKLD